MMAGMLTIISFQNCSPFRFSQQSNVQLSSSIQPAEEVPTQVNPTQVKKTNLLTYPINKSQIMSPVKIVLVIDDSASMSVYQQKLKAGLSKFLDAVKNLNVEIAIITTSMYGDGTQWSRSWAVNGNGELSEVKEGIHPKTDGEYIQERKLHNGNFVSFKMPPNRKEADFLDVKNSILKRIDSIGTKGNSDEKGFCSAIAALMDDEGGRPINSFIHTGDKVSFVFLTDEDDTHKSIDCIKNVKTPFTSKITTVNLYTIGTIVRATYTYNESVKNDGVTVKTFQVRYLNLGPSNFTIEKTITAARRECSFSERQQIEKKLNVTASMISGFMNCEIVLVDAQIQTDDNPCTGGLIHANGRIFSNLNDYYSKVPDTNNYYEKFCRAEKPVTGYIPTVRYNESVTAYWTPQSELTTTTTATVFKNLLQQKLGSGSFQITAIVDNGTSCANDNASEIGKNYIDLVKNLNMEKGGDAIHKVQSICDNEYTPALDRITTFTEKMSLMGIPFDKNKIKNIQKAYIQRRDKSTKELVLGSDLNLSAGVIDLSSQIQLQDGDSLAIELQE